MSTAIAVDTNRAPGSGLPDVLPASWEHIGFFRLARYGRHLRVDLGHPLFTRSKGPLVSDVHIRRSVTSEGSRRRHPHSVQGQVRRPVKERAANGIAAIKGNQPSASAQAEALRWEQVSVARAVSEGRGRAAGVPLGQDRSHRGDPRQDRLPARAAGPARPPAPPGGRQRRDHPSDPGHHRQPAPAGNLTPPWAVTGQADRWPSLTAVTNDAQPAEGKTSAGP